MTFDRWMARGALLFVSLGTQSCISRTPGTSVELTALSSPGGAPRAELTSDQGYSVALDQLYIVVSEVALVRCASAPTTSPAVGALRELFGLSIAHAHGTNTDTTWTVPQVLTPIKDSEPVSLAVLHPPATEYCSIRVSLGAADSDAERMPEELDLVGLSMFVTGSYGSGNAPPKVSFRYESNVSTTAELPLTDSAGRRTVLSLSDANLHSTLRLELAYKHLFDGLALFPGAFSSVGDIVLDQALQHASVVVETEVDSR
jgi:hypothetical protein